MKGSLLFNYVRLTQLHAHGDHLPEQRACSDKRQASSARASDVRTIAPIAPAHIRTERKGPAPGTLRRVKVCARPQAIPFGFLAASLYTLAWA